MRGAEDGRDVKKRCRLSIDFEIEAKDFTDVPVLRGESPEDMPGEYIVEWQQIRH